MENQEQNQEEETSWGKIIVIGFIILLFLIATILAVVQNFVALKAIQELKDASPQSLEVISYQPNAIYSKDNNKTCYKNNIEINCSIIDKYLEDIK
jgi:uncharacterized membrane protein